MCDITICEKRNVILQLSENSFDYLISINDPYKNQKYFEYKHRKWMNKLTKHISENNILCLYFEDVLSDWMRYSPSSNHIERIIEFAEKCRNKKVLIHCVMGISRSTAAGVILAAELGKTLEEAINYIRFIRPIADPNNLMLKIYKKYKGIVEEDNWWNEAPILLLNNEYI